MRAAQNSCSSRGPGGRVAVSRNRSSQQRAPSARLQCFYHLRRMTGNQPHLDIFRGQLQRTRLGRRVAILNHYFRSGAGDIDQIRTLAKELVALKPDVIVGRSTPVTESLLQATTTIPIVFLVVSDPVGDGIVVSFAKPGRNVTRIFTNVEASLGKWLRGRSRYKSRR